MQRLFASFGWCDAADRQWKLDVAQRSEPWKQIAVLGHVADVGVQTKHRSALVEDGTIRCGHQPRGETKQRGLAAAGRTYDGRDFSGWNVEADAVERKHVMLLTRKCKPN